MLTLLRILFIYIPMLYGYYAFIFVMFIDDTERYEFQSNDQQAVVTIVK